VQNFPSGIKLRKSVEYNKTLQMYHPSESGVESQLWENCCVYIMKTEPDYGKATFSQQQNLKKYVA
jgi:hypothetical protein